MRTIKNILVPVDVMEETGFVVEYAKLFAEKFDAKITLFYARPPVDKLYDTYLAEEIISQLKDEAKQRAVASLEKIADTLTDAVDVSIKVRRGQPQDVIYQMLKTDEYDLVIMGTHCRRGMDRILFGSVANRIVKHSNIPVLTVHPEECKVKK